VANKRNGYEIGRENEDKALKLDWLKDPTTQEKTRAGSAWEKKIRAAETQMKKSDLGTS
jgi:hypothetical protein